MIEILLVIINIFKEYLDSLIIATVSILATFFTLKYQLKRDEINRLHEQRKKTYEKIVNLFIDALERNKLGKQPLSIKELNERFFDILRPLIIYGSTSVMNKYRKLQSLRNQIDPNKKNDALTLLSYIEDLIVEIRKELNPKENIKKGNILSLFIDDWDKQNQNE